MDQGVLNRLGGAPPHMGLVQTTAGDWEIESKSRRYNALEAVLLYLMLLCAQWPFAYMLGVVPGNDLIAGVAWVPIVLGAIYLLFASPFVHKDSLESWGLGNPRHVAQLLTSGAAWRRALLAAVLLALFAGLNYANYSQWREVAGFFGLDDLAKTLGYEKSAAYDLPRHPLGMVFVLLVGSVLGALIVLFAIRYDNFGSAFLTAMKISAPLFAITCFGAFIHRGPAAFREFDAATFFADVGGYWFWGWVQQLLFSSYFCTRLRKGFGPSASPTNVVAPGNRLPVSFGIGLAIAGTLAPLGFFGVRWLYGAEAVPAIILFYFFAFAFPFGACFGYVYSLDRKRMLVATLCASFFGLIHLESYGLVAVTFLLGVILCYVFMEDRNRNLAALGFIHGLLGSTFGWLFSDNEAGALEVDYSVGPWNVEDPTYAAGIFPILCCVVYACVAWWCARNLSSAPPARTAG